MKKIVLITGTSSGIGKAVAEHLYPNHTVIGTARNATKVKSDFQTISLDVTEKISVQNAIKSIFDQYGRIDVLINNAGYGISGAVEDTALEEAKAQFETNYWGTVRMIQGILPIMRAQKSGLIINVSSMGGLFGLPFQAFYSSSKFALEGLTESLRMEVRPFNIHVTNINPGDFNTNFVDNRKFIKKVNSDYQKQFKTTLQVYEAGERNGVSPMMIAKLVERLIQKNKNYKIRYVIGRPYETSFAMLVKRFLGNAFFEKALRNTFKI
jgi:short-subunit dehydrogenase